MLKTRTLNGERVFYESTTGVVLKNIKSVSILGVPDAVITVVYKDGVAWVHLPHRENTPLVKLTEAIEKMELQITKVA